jgi:Protein of unknown function (DUF664)
MTSADVLVEAFRRIRGIVHAVVEGLTPDQLTYRPDSEANSIAWLVWHLTRIEDDHLADAAQAPQIWTSQGWAERCALPFRSSATGYGHRSQDVAAVMLSAELLLSYHDAVYEFAVAYVKGLADSDLDRTVDERWDPPVTLGVRLVSVISDGLQHAGQAAYVRGIVEPGTR